MGFSHLADKRALSAVLAFVRSGRSVPLADARCVCHFHHSTSILIIARPCCFSSHLQNPDSEDFCRWVVWLFPLYFMVAFFLSLGYYGIVHFTKVGINTRRRLVLMPTYDAIYTNCNTAAQKNAHTHTYTYTHTHTHTHASYLFAEILSHPCPLTHAYLLNRLQITRI